MSTFEFESPNRLRFDKNVSSNFHKFMQVLVFDIYLSADDLSFAENERKISIFLNLAGEEAVDVFNTFKTPKAMKPAKALRRAKKILVPLLKI